MFWSLILEPGKRYDSDLADSFHLSMASLDTKSIKNENELFPVYIENEHKQKVVVCNLSKSKFPQVNLDLVFTKGTKVAFSTAGTATVHLTGYKILEEEEDYDSDDEDSLDETMDSTVSEEKPKRGDFLYQTLLKLNKEKDAQVNSSSSKLDKSKKGAPVINSVSSKRKFESESEPVPNPLKKKKKKKMEIGQLLDSEDEEDMKQWKSFKKGGSSDDDEHDADSDEDDQDEDDIIMGGSTGLEDDSEDDDDDEDDDNYDDSEDEDDSNETPKQKPLVKNMGKMNGTLPKNVKIETPKQGKQNQQQKTPNGQKQNQQLQQQQQQKTPKDQKKQNQQLQTPKSLLKQNQQPQQKTPTVQQQQLQSPKSQQKQNQQQKTPKDQAKGQQNVATPGKKQVMEGGVIVEDLKAGEGPPAKPGKMVTVYYTGRLKHNNKVFDETTEGAGFKFRLGRNEVIKGWDIGLSGMKVGSKRRISCPPPMAYGQKGSPPAIPPNSTLVFDVELKGVQ